MVNILKGMVIFAVATTLVACGGGGSDSGTRAVERSADAFIGSWAGQYTKPDGTVAGTVRMMIVRAQPSDSFVTVTGTATNTELGNGTITGSIPDNRRANAVLTFTTNATPSSTLRFSGNAFVRLNPTLVILHDPTVGGAPESLPTPYDFTLTPTSGATSN